MVTIKDISSKTGYSVTTVSKAFNNYSDISQKAKDMILATAKEMGYQPNASARSLVTKKSWTIGVVFEESTGVGITHSFFGNILDRIKKHVEKEGYDILFISQSIGHNVNSYIDHCHQKRVDGIIILCSYVEDQSINELIESDIPSVVIDYDTKSTNCVYTDSFKSLYEAVSYLVNKGHKKIGHLYGDLYSFAGNERYKGYKQAMEDFNIPFQEKYVFPGTTFSLEEGYERGLDIADVNDRPTAIIAASDNLAIGLMKAFEEKGIRVPEDISIIGFDNIRLTTIITPNLTTINQDKEAIASAAAKSLLNQIENKQKSHDKIKIKGALIERDTVKSL